MTSFLVWLMIFINSHPSVVTIYHSGMYGIVLNDYLHDGFCILQPNVNGNNDTEDRGVEQLVTMEYDEGNSSSCLVRGNQ